MIRAACTIALVALSACLTNPSAANLAAPERDRIEVAVAATKEQAIERALSAFVGEGLTVARSEGGIIQSEPVKIKSLGMDVGIVTYTTTVIGDGEARSRAVVSALLQDVEPQVVRGPPQTADVRRQPITSHYKSMFIPHWQRVERIAAAIGRSQE